MSDNFQLVNVLRLMGKNDKVIRHYDKILESLDSKKLPERYAWCLTQQGEAQLQLGNLKEAQENLEEATTLNPNSAWAQAKLGELWRTMGNNAKDRDSRWANYNTAIEYFDKALTLEPDYAWARAHRGATFANARLQKLLFSIDYSVEIDGILNKSSWGQAEWKELIATFKSRLQFQSDENLEKFSSFESKAPKLKPVNTLIWHLDIEEKLYVAPKSQEFADGKTKYILEHNEVTHKFDVFQFMYEEAKFDLEKANTLLDGKYSWAIGYLGTTEFIKAVEVSQDKTAKNYQEKLVSLLLAQNHLINAVLGDNSLLNMAIVPGQKHSSIFLELAQLLFQMEQYREALQYSDKALQEAEEIQNLEEMQENEEKKQNLRYIYYLRSRIYGAPGNKEGTPEERASKKKAEAQKLLDMLPKQSVDQEKVTPESDVIPPYEAYKKAETNAMLAYALSVLSDFHSSSTQKMVSKLSKTAEDDKRAWRSQDWLAKGQEQTVYGNIVTAPPMAKLKAVSYVFDWITMGENNNYKKKDVINAKTDCLVWK